MFPTLSLQSIISVWRDALKNNTGLINYCQAHYGKSPEIIIGYKQAGQSDCPEIILRPGDKIEGADRHRNIYPIRVDWAISNAAETVTGNVTEQAALTEIDDLGQLIIGILGEASASNPVSRVEYSIDGSGFPLVVGKMVLKTYIAPVMGSTIIY